MSKRIKKRKKRTINKKRAPPKHLPEILPELYPPIETLKFNNSNGVLIERYVYDHLQLGGQGLGVISNCGLDRAVIPRPENAGIDVLHRLAT